LSQRSGSDDLPPATVTTAERPDDVRIGHVDGAERTLAAAECRRKRWRRRWRREKAVEKGEGAREVDAVVDAADDGRRRRCAKEAAWKWATVATLCGL